MMFFAKALAGGSVRRILALAALLLVTATAVPVSIAEDIGTLTQSLVSGPDFRVRVAAALSLGKTKNRAALAPLVAALDDRHPAVRTAAAAGLGALGNKAALKALRAHLASEPAKDVKREIEHAIAGLDKLGKTKVLVKIGDMRNKSGPAGDRLLVPFRGATTARASEVPGIEVIDDEAETKTRKLPLVMIDGVLHKVAQSASGNSVAVSVRVEYVVRKMPEHALKATMSGSAQAEGSASLLTDERRFAELQEAALEGAVESAMRGAPTVMQAAIH
jgi:hypothetical protein